MSAKFIKVIISKGNAVTVPTVDGQTPDEDGIDPFATDSSRIGKAASVGGTVSKKMTNAVFNVADTMMSSYETISEDYKLGTAVQNTKAVLSLGGNMVSSTISGALTGMKIGGPIGAIIGGVLGLGSSAVTSYVSASREYNNALLSIQQVAYSNYFQSSRSGYMDGGRGNND